MSNLEQERQVGEVFEYKPGLYAMHVEDNDDRVDRILNNPEEYFAEARERAREEIRALVEKAARQR